MKHAIHILLLAITLAAMVLLAARPHTVTAVPNSFSCTQVTQIPQTECQALVALYNSTNGPNWYDQTGWLATNTPCNWFGISCNASSVEEINLFNSSPWWYEGNNLSGPIPSEIGNLTNLKVLNLFDNRITSLPPQIGSLSNLRYIGLSFSNLTNIPPEIGNLANLQNLYLEGNQLTSVPPQIGNLTNLQDLSLSSNQLISLPPEIGNLTNLHILYLYSNQLISLPPEIGALSSLQDLYLNENQLTSLPPEIGNLANLEMLGLSDNRLTSLPSEFGYLTRLQGLYMIDNLLTGPIPVFMTALTELNYFMFDNTFWCVPEDGPVSVWLDGIPTHSTGYFCGLRGLVTGEQGQPLANAQVLLYGATTWNNGDFVANLRTDNTGGYNFGELEQGVNYYLHFQVEDGVFAPEYYENQSSLILAEPITITVDRIINAQLSLAHPPLVQVTPGNGRITSSANPLNGQLAILVPEPEAAAFTLHYAATCTGGDTPSAVVLTYNGQSYPMSLNNALYEATIPATAVTTSGDLTITVSCTSSDTPVTVGQVVLYTPNGIITDSLTAEPVQGAKVTLYQVPGWFPRTAPNDTRPNTCESNNSKPANQPWSQPAPTELGILVNLEQTAVAPLVNQQWSNDAGEYGWEAPEGCWYMVIEAPGYATLTSPVVGMPPPVDDLHLALTPPIYFPLVAK